MSNRDGRFVLGIAGIGGYAKAMTTLVLDVADRVDPPVRLAAVCDPALDQHAERVAELRGHGITVLDSFQKLLAVEEIEAVWLPLPIALHRPFTEQALAAGKAVMCEKPAAGTVDEVDAMIAARDRAGLPVIIGFQAIYHPSTLQSKRRLLAGDIGKVRRAVVHGCWPRAATYFQRTAWAGRLRQGEAWVLDSPAQNAMSHLINTTLFMLGPDEATSATPVAVEAELYRAAAIENYDTISARMTLPGGAELLVLQTHACTETINPTLHIEGERGTMHWEAGAIEWTTSAGTERVERDGSDRPTMVQQFARLVRGQPDPDVAIAQLEVARAHTVFINGASEATPVRTVAAEHIDPRPFKDNTSRPFKESTVHAIRDIEATIAHCAANHQMLHESGRLPFTQPAGRRDLHGYRHFAGPHPETLASAEAATAGR